MEGLPPRLQAALEELARAPKALKADLLLEYAHKVPSVPPGSQLERVEECMTPFAVRVELREGKVHLIFSVGEEAPTVKAFAGLLLEGLEGASPEEVLAVPESFYLEGHLEELLSPLRLRGLQAALLRIKQQLRKLVPPPATS